MPQQTVKLRPYQSSDEQPALALWQRSWQQTYPQIDFSKRLDWFREHWTDLQLNSKVVVAEYEPGLPYATIQDTLTELSKSLPDVLERRLASL